MMRALVGCVGLAVLASTVRAQQPAAPAKPVATVNGEAVPNDLFARVVDSMLKERFKVQPPTDEQRRQERARLVKDHGPVVEELDSAIELMGKYTHSRKHLKITWREVLEKEAARAKKAKAAVTPASAPN